MKQFVHSTSAIFVMMALIAMAGCGGNHPAAPSSSTPPMTASQPAPSPATLPTAETNAPTSAPSTTTAMIPERPAPLDHIDVSSVTGEKMLAGTQRCITKKGIRYYHEGAMTVFAGRKPMAVTVVKVAFKKISELNAEDAANNGFASVTDYDDSLRRAFPTLGDNDDLTMVFFKIVNPPAAASTQKITD